MHARTNLYLVSHLANVISTDFFQYKIRNIAWESIGESNTTNMIKHLDHKKKEKTFFYKLEKLCGQNGAIATLLGT